MKQQLLVLMLVSSSLAALPAFAQKQAQEVDVQRGPTSQLYIRKRPPTPEAPVLTAELKKLLASTERRRDDKRLQAIGMLREFLDSKPTGESRAEGIFKLAELPAISRRNRASISRKPRRCTASCTTSSRRSAAWISSPT